MITTRELDQLCHDHPRAIFATRRGIITRTDCDNTVLSESPVNDGGKEPVHTMRAWELAAVTHPSATTQDIPVQVVTHAGHTLDVTQAITHPSGMIIYLDTAAPR